MTNALKERLRAVGVEVPRILLPAKNVPMERYAVIACDQFSAQPDYWQQAESVAAESPSALRMIFPEAYLMQGMPEDPATITRAMNGYLAEGALEDVGETMVYVQRTTTSGVRSGLVLALDLEHYEYKSGAQTLIRATEATVEERLPARIAIRKEAPLELPHIMVLIDDRNNLLFGGLADKILEPLYDFDLMLDGGNIKGFRVDDEESLSGVAEALEQLAAASGGFLYAMGDGNHSFAAAKACWEAIKPSLSEQEREAHPARFALCEIVNLYDPALDFEPIHRLLINVDAEAVQREVGFEADCPPSLQELQPKLDAWLANHPETEIEYIHGEDTCRELGEKDGCLAIIFPEFDKDSLFDVVREKGAFVRKSFSMGTARDKRYYLEARKIK